MANINLQESSIRRAGVKRMKKHNLKTDMTPMVDLGFLLITFFVFTTEITRPVAMNLYMPHDGNATTAGETKSISILQGSDNKLFYYFGREEDAEKNNAVLPVSYDEKSGIGKVIREKQSLLERIGVSKNELTVLIKPTNGSSYKNAVDILDEITINSVTRYALTKPSAWEKEYVEKNK